MALVHPGGGRHELHGRDAELDEVVERRGRREAREGAPRRLGHAGVALREAAHVQFGDDGAGPGRGPVPRVGQDRGGHDALGHGGGAVGLVDAPVAFDEAPHAPIEPERPVERQRVRVDQELGGVEPVSLVRRIGTVGPQTVARAFLDARHVGVEHVSGPLGQADPLDLAVAVLAEQAQVDRVGVGGEDRHVDAARRERHAQRLGRTL